VTSKTKSVLWLLGSAAMLLPLLHPECSWAPDHRHKIPSDCDRSYQEMLADLPTHRNLCAAHAYARGCSAEDGSVGSVECCLGLWRLAQRTQDPEIVELCRRYVPGDDCDAIGDLDSAAK
jgi:hypothetical protein